MCTKAAMQAKFDALIEDVLTEEDQLPAKYKAKLIKMDEKFCFNIINEFCLSEKEHDPAAPVHEQ